jgi:ABC-type branched-subunit amino acid transport system substrate-binding protein
MMVASLSAIAVVRADHRNAPNRLAAGASNANDQSLSGVESSGSGDASGGASDATGSADESLTGASGSSGAASGASSGAKTATGAAKSGATGHIAPSSGTNCPDYNPNIGVFCDHILVGGTTVLSGPLAVYGDQGLKGGLAWINYFNTQIAPKEGLRKTKLIWYDDNLDTTKTLQYVQRLNEVDHVLYLGGITSPEAASKYLQTAKFPMIGDIGLSPKSYTNPYIFPTAPSDITRNPLRVKLAVQRYHIKSFGVIEDVLPSVDTTPIKAAWKKGAADYGVKMTPSEPQEIASTASDCSGQFAAVIHEKPEYIFLPTATGVLLACLREARKFSVQPGSSSSPWLKGWSGGSNLQVEVDNCKPTCEGMLSIGTIFADPRVSQTPQMATYRENMAKYAPNVDITGFIAINYYHTGYVFYKLITTSHIESNLTRETLVNAANHFGPFDTGFGNIIKWTPQLPREPWTCGYPVIVKGDKWVFESEKNCL